MIKRIVFFLVIITTLINTSFSFHEYNSVKSYCTVKNGLLITGATVGSVCLYKLITALMSHYADFTQLVTQAREKKKKKEQRREKNYKIAQCIGAPAVTILDNFYALKSSWAKKWGKKLCAHLIAEYLPN